MSGQQNNAFAEPWPEGVTFRYATKGAEISGLPVFVDVDDRPHWRCTGCRDTSVGKYTGPFGTPFPLDAIHEQAQAHAEKCRALPRPVVKA